ncbi:hypothetical protein Tco_0175034 [Tanacetum coccineum]
MLATYTRTWDTGVTGMSLWQVSGCLFRSSLTCGSQCPELQSGNSFFLLKVLESPLWALWGSLHCISIMSRIRIRAVVTYHLSCHAGSVIDHYYLFGASSDTGRWKLNFGNPLDEISNLSHSGHQSVTSKDMRSRLQDLGVEGDEREVQMWVYIGAT